LTERLDDTGQLARLAMFDEVDDVEEVDESS
jgi:hypothetical protein